MQADQAPETQTEDVIYRLAAPAGGGRAARRPCFAARLSGLAVSHDGGRQWCSAYRSLGLREPLPTLAVAVAPDFEREPAIFAGYNGGLLRSLDGGETWTNSDFPPPAPAIVALVVSPTFPNDRLVFAGTLADGVFYSPDGGARWKTGNLGLIDMNVLCLGISPNFAADQTVLAGTHSGLFCSRTAGRAWREVDLPCGYDAVLSLALSPNFAADGTIWAGTETQGLWCSEDSGRRWRRLGQPVLTGSISQIVLGLQAPRPLHALVLYDGQLSASDDGGATWHPWWAPAWNVEPLAAVLAPRGFGAGAPVWLGLERGPIIRVQG